MTIETQTLTPQKPGLAARGSTFLKVLAGLLFITALCAWISLGVGLAMDVERGTKLILALAAALSTEALFWTIAALLGVSVFRARTWIWRKITGRGEQGA
ncbi:hypothetical protein [Brevundimonas sp.]